LELREAGEHEMKSVGPIVDDRDIDLFRDDDCVGSAPPAITSVQLANDLHFVIKRHVSVPGRLFDVIVGVSILVVCMPIFVILAIAVKLDSPGPVLFRQTRSGQGGRPFKILKFRTMIEGSDHEFEQLLAANPDLSLEFGERAKLTSDPRVSRLGRILRPLGLDELPQIINVIRGDMSIVGPRPIAVGEETRYGAKAGLLWSVKPGLTGVWQLNGRNDTTYAERVAFDMSYMQKKSVRFDAALLALTVVKFLGGRLHGGY
jgi:lipopolysaccharide/colanic/teichoic acid biosynthesis glycosyltransferase